MLKIFILLLFNLVLAQAQSPSLNRAVDLCLQGFSEVKNSGKVICEVDKQVQKSSLSNIDNKTFEVSSLSYEYLQELFGWLRSQKHIPFEYPEDGCYARAHEMARLLESKGVIAGKAFIEGDLRVETKNSPKGYVEWWYHVAPVVNVRVDGQLKAYVIDPSIFDRPVPAEEWYHIQTKHQLGRTDATYYTPRFNIGPFEKGEMKTTFDSTELKEMKDVLKEISHTLKERKKGK